MVPRNMSSKANKATKIICVHSILHKYEDSICISILVSKIIVSFEVVQGLS